MNQMNALQPQGALPGIGTLVGSGLDVFKGNAVPMILGTLIVAVVAAIPILNLANLVLFPGLLVMALRAAAGTSTDVQDIAAALKRPLPIVLTSFVVGLGIAVGSVFLVVPGLIVAILCQYAVFLCIDRELEPGEAIKQSFDIVKGDFVNHLVLLLVIGFISSLGGIALGVGALLTMPLGFCIHAVAYRELFGIQGGTDRLVGR